MTTPIKLRVTGFTLAIVLAALLVGWAAHTTWRQVGQLSAKFTSTQIESFQTADQFHAKLDELNYRLLLYEINHNRADWDAFVADWHRYDHWIDVQLPTLRTQQERAFLDQINAAYDGYFAAATNLLVAVEGRPVDGASPLANFQNVETESRRLTGLVYQLAGAHRESLNHFLSESQASLAFLRRLIYGALFFLFVFGAWLGVVVYREMILPLRLKLVETRAILERQEKLASLGLLGAGVAHEIRNPLTAIKARLFIQQKRLKLNSPERADAEVIGEEINRLERIVKDFLQFARPSDPEPERLEATQPLRDVCALLAPQLEKSGIRLRLQDHPASPVLIDPQQIKQVLINLVQNAAESIGTNGTITLRTRPDALRLAERLTEVVVLEVADTGKGIAPEVEKRLFDPFFSTKDNGTGLGLAIAARIVEKHGGALQYQTQVNRGTTFGIVLPVASS